MTISIIIPCFKQAHFLGECIASLQAQSHRDWEAIIVNDGSPDDTEAVARRLCAVDARVRYVSKPNGGLSSARNAGLAVMRGSEVQFLDADDLLEPGKLSQQLQVLDQDPSVGLVYGRSFYFRTDDPERKPFLNAFLYGDEQRDWMAELAAKPGATVSKLFQTNLYPVCAPLIRRAVLGDPPHFHEALAALEDWDLWTRLAARGVEFRYAPAAGSACLVRVHGASMTHDKRRMRMAELALRSRQLVLARLTADRVFLLGELVGHMKDEALANGARGLPSDTLTQLEGLESLAIGLARLAYRYPALYRVLTRNGRLLPWRIHAIARSAL